MKKITWLPYGIALCLLGVATWYDYAITDAIYGSLPIISGFFERIILIPVISVVMITLVMLFIARHSRWYLLLGYSPGIYRTSFLSQRTYHRFYGDLMFAGMEAR